MNQLILDILSLQDNGNLASILSFDLKLDEFFNLQVTTVEQSIESNHEDAYIGLDTRALLTSYLDYYNILKRIPKNETLVDLGAGHCRGTLLSVYLNLAKCISYEYIEERTKQAKEFLEKMNVENDLIYSENLISAKLIDAYAYYLYFPRGSVLDILIKNLWEASRKKDIRLFVCESHGDVLDYLKGLNLLSIEEEFPCSLPRHYQNIVCFKFKNIEPFNICWQYDLSLWMLLNKNKKNYVFVIDYFHIHLNKSVKWLVPMGEVCWILYQGRKCLQTIGGRIIEISLKEKILELALINHKVRALFENKNYKKIFIIDDNKYEFETN